MSSETNKSASSPAPDAGNYTGPQPSDQCRGNFKNLASSQAEEDAFDFARFRGVTKTSGVIGSTAHLIKGALGGGILGGHVAFMKGGTVVSILGTIIFALYIGYSLYVLVKSAFIIYKRTRVPIMSYPDVGEAALAIFPNPRVARFSTCFRYCIDFTICLDLFGSCACYQIIIATTIKQLVEKTQQTGLEGVNGNPHLRVYLAIMIIPVILICFITHLKWLAPFSLLANLVIVVCIGTTVVYSMELNPHFENLKPATTFYHTVEFIGMSVFSMSCAGVVLPVCNNLTNPYRYPFVIVVGMFFIVLFVVLISFFGYNAFLEECASPITMNFPLTGFPIALKGMIAGMIYVTHALNFWVPFNLVFFYIAPKHNKEKILFWELFYRAVIVIIIAIVAIAFPNINSLMGFLGAFCLSNMAFIWPNLIELLLLYERPGYGPMKWRLWKSVFLIMVGVFLCVVGSVVNMRELILGLAA